MRKLLCYALIFGLIMGVSYAQEEKKEEPKEEPKQEEKKEEPKEEPKAEEKKEEPKQKEEKKAAAYVITLIRIDSKDDIANPEDLNIESEKDIVYSKTINCSEGDLVQGNIQWKQLKTETMTMDLATGSQSKESGTKDIEDSYKIKLNFKKGDKKNAQVVVVLNLTEIIDENPPTSAGQRTWLAMAITDMKEIIVRGMVVQVGEVTKIPEQKKLNSSKNASRIQQKAKSGKKIQMFIKIVKA